MGEGGRVAKILAIGIANPSTFISQADYPDYYFRVTKSEHMTQLKEKFKRICEKTMINKRHVLLTEEMLKNNPNICAHDSTSLDTRQQILIDEIPKYGKEAAIKAIDEWGQPKSKITHLICVSIAGVDMPGVDYKLINLIGLEPNVKRIMLYHQGCYIGSAALRMAKDIAENNSGARVLVVCCDISMVGFFRGPPSEQADDIISSLVGQAIVGDGAASVIISADDDNKPNEKPLFEIVSTMETIIPGSDDAIKGHVLEKGLTLHLKKDVWVMVSENIEKYLVDAFGSTKDWNSIFWSVHTGGAAILNSIEAKLGLEHEKLEATRHVLRNYGNMGGASVLFILDEIRKKSSVQGKANTGEGFEYGALIGYGPGITVDVVVLRSVATVTHDT